LASAYGSGGLVFLTVLELAPAKINLFLDVLRRRDDGYHDLRTLFVELDWADELSLEAEEGACAVRELRVDGPFADGVPRDERNLVWRALALFLRETSAPLSFAVRLTKNIPHGAGLGAGSSDAAAALRGANRLAGDPLSPDQLVALAAQIGSDCAFFVRGGAALAEGRGELLEALPLGRQCAVLIVKPPFPVETRIAYGALRPEHLGEWSDAEGARRWIAGEAPLPTKLGNSFEAALYPTHRELEIIRTHLSEAGAFVARLSGSGSASFGLFESEAAARGAEKLFPEYFVQCCQFSTRHSSRSPRIT
jgi:4-diphosphocytidyl-2-C-methyl-D-erythritol kinase